MVDAISPIPDTCSSDRGSGLWYPGAGKACFCADGCTMVVGSAAGPAGTEPGMGGGGVLGPVPTELAVLAAATENLANPTPSARGANNPGAPLAHPFPAAATACQAPAALGSPSAVLLLLPSAAASVFEALLWLLLLPPDPANKQSFWGTGVVSRAVGWP